jgi:hypothetical protein
MLTYVRVALCGRQVCVSDGLLLAAGDYTFCMLMQVRICFVLFYFTRVSFYFISFASFFYILVPFGFILLVFHFLILPPER